MLRNSKVVYKASCWDCDDFYIGKTKRRLHDWKNEHFKALKKSWQASAIADHIRSKRVQKSGLVSRDLNLSWLSEKLSFKNLKLYLVLRNSSHLNGHTLGFHPQT